MMESTIKSYSNNNCIVYDDPMNLKFVYGELTDSFVKNITLSDSDRVIADIGCGTGFAFDLIRRELEKRTGQYIGIEPAQGMLDLARQKYNSNDQFSFYSGSFEAVPLEDHSVDKIISTLALHWVSDIEKAVKELQRILKPGGSIDILMIAKDDGESFKRPIVRAMRNHLTFKQVMKAASLAQRVSAVQLEKYFSKHFRSRYCINVENYKKVIYGSFDEHMKWWKARSVQIISEIKNETSFIHDLRVELNKIDEGYGIPFDLSVLKLHLKGIEK